MTLSESRCLRKEGKDTERNLGNSRQLSKAQATQQKKLVGRKSVHNLSFLIHA
jgi:hypothetical protein